MASKPASTPRWANVSGAIVVPGAGKLDVGHVTAERPPAQYENWFKNLTWQWLEYLKDGALVGAHSISGLLSANGGIAVPTGQHVTLSGTSEIKHGDRTVWFPAMGLFNANHSYDFVNDYVAAAAATGESRYSIPVQPGDRIKSFSVVRYPNAAAYSCVFAIYKRTSGGVVSVYQTSGATLNTPNIAAWRHDAVAVSSPVAASAGDQFWLYWGTATQTQRFGGFSITYDRP